MNGLNKVMLIGNLGKDPELKKLDSGTMVATFPLATSESFKDRSGQRVDKTEWHNIVVWRSLAEIADKILQKGSMCYLEGKLVNRTWTDKDGIKRYNTEIVADELILLDRGKKDFSEGRRPDVRQRQEGKSKPNTDSPIKDDGDTKDDLPF